LILTISGDEILCIITPPSPPAPRIMSIIQAKGHSVQDISEGRKIGSAL
jgi:regulator of extracellular matrix RemA (YlzA/DUF370 family)